MTYLLRPLGVSVSSPLLGFMPDNSPHLSLKDISPPLRLLCHQLPRPSAKRQQKHALLLLHSCGECPGEIKHFLRHLTCPDLPQPSGWHASKSDVLQDAGEAMTEKFTHCLFTAEGSPFSSTAEGLQVLSRPRPTQLLACSPAAAQASKSRDAQA